MGDVDEMVVAQILTDGVTGPRAAAHGQGKAETIVETAAVAEGMGLVYQHTDNI